MHQESSKIQILCKYNEEKKKIHRRVFLCAVTIKRKDYSYDNNDSHRGRDYLDKFEKLL